MTTSTPPIAAMAMAAALSACGDQAIVITNHHEIAARREFASPIIRGADGCVDEISRRQEVGYGEFANLMLQVDRTGHARLIDLQVTSITDTMQLCRRQVEAAISSWNYRPFERHGRAAPAEIVERALMLPAERWRVPRRQFPEIANLDAVLITLERPASLPVTMTAPLPTPFKFAVVATSQSGNARITTLAGH